MYTAAIWLHLSPFRYIVYSENKECWTDLSEIHASSYLPVGICLYPPQKSSLLIYMYALTLKLSVATIGLLFWCGDGLWRLCSMYKNNGWIIVTNCFDSKVSIPINHLSFMHIFYKLYFDNVMKNVMMWCIMTWTESMNVSKIIANKEFD